MFRKPFSRTFLMAILLSLLALTVGWGASEALAGGFLKAKCKNCEGLVKTYNSAEAALEEARNSRDDLLDTIADMNSLKRPKSMPDAKKGEGLSEDAEKYAAFASDYLEVAEEIKNKDLPELDQLIQNLEYSTKDLKTQINECEKQCNSGNVDEELGALGVPMNYTPQLPFDWEGPYEAVCEPCAALATRLNMLPAAVLKTLTELDTAKVELKISENRYKMLDAGGQGVVAFGEKGAVKTASAMKERINELKKRIKELNREYENSQKNFKETLKLYNDCIKQCKKAEAPATVPRGDCSYGDATAMAIGPNDQYGTGAKFSNDLKDKAKGMAMGGMPGLGGGFGMGGGGMMDDAIGTEATGNGGASGPKLDKDPTSGKFIKVSANGIDLEQRANVLGDGKIAVSTEIDKAPGDGTFHQQWIEDGKGNVYRPVKYLILSLYNNWKLTVWWDYKRWKNNELVEHKHGEEVTYGKTEIGHWKVWISDVEHAIWSAMGFKTAVKGLDGLGTIYDIPATAKASACPLRLVTMISKPKEDPVLAVPMISTLSFDENGKPTQKFVAAGDYDPERDDDY